MTTILYAHPYDGSFNHALLTEVQEKLRKQGRDHNVIDLYADGFNPILDAASLRLYSRGETADPLVEKYLKFLMESDALIMIFPIWWGMMPAMVKGFFDKVMLSGKAYKYSETGELIPDKIDIKRTVMVTTSQADTDRFRPFFTGYFKPLVLEAIGMKNLEWYNCDKTAHGPQENRDEFYKMIHEKI